MERASPRALVGWKREPSRSGIVVTLQLIADHAAYRAGEVDRVPVVLSDRQLRCSPAISHAPMPNAAWQPLACAAGGNSGAGTSRVQHPQLPMVVIARSSPAGKKRSADA
ncbi:hypothetical protein AB5I41_17545 [Sphingomonas sp. MMS24-JH45]